MSPLPQPSEAAANFSKAAAQYDRYASVQRRAVDALKAWLPPATTHPKLLDAGAGTGYALEPGWIALDHAFGMCQQLPAAICADMQSLPLPEGVVDGVFSSLALQWLPQPELFFAEAHRVTRIDGVLLIATLLPRSLQELRAAYLAIGQERSPILPFRPLDELKTAAEQAGWTVTQERQVLHQENYDSVRLLLNSIKGLGAKTKPSLQSGLSGKAWLKQLATAYPTAPSTPEKITASWEFYYLKAVKNG